jgi:hypothetical protein
MTLETYRKTRSSSRCAPRGRRVGSSRESPCYLVLPVVWLCFIEVAEIVSVKWETGDTKIFGIPKYEI